jgi:hypothetical protein
MNRTDSPDPKSVNQRLMSYSRFTLHIIGVIPSKKGRLSKDTDVVVDVKAAIMPLRGSILGSPRAGDIQHLRLELAPALVALRVENLFEHDRSVVNQVVVRRTSRIVFGALLAEPLGDHRAAVDIDDPKFEGRVDYIARTERPITELTQGLLDIEQYIDRTGRLSQLHYIGGVNVDRRGAHRDDAVLALRVQEQRVIHLGSRILNVVVLDDVLTVRDPDPGTDRAKHGVAACHRHETGARALSERNGFAAQRGGLAILYLCGLG